MPRQLHFQIQKIRSKQAGDHVEMLLHVIHGCIKSVVNVDFQLDISDNCCNLTVITESPKKYWKKVLAFLQEDVAEYEWLCSRWIVVTQGRRGWDDYRLLAHFDPSVKID